MMAKRPRIVLYNPQAVFFTMPLALIAVGSALDPSRYEVTIVDGRLEGDPLPRLLHETETAVCLGISVLTGAPIRDALRVSRAIKAARPELPIIWGGWHPSLFAAACLEEPSIDVVVSGQGEDTLREIVERLVGGDGLEGCRGAGFRRDGRPIVNPPRELGDVNVYPPHDYSLIPVDRYFELKAKRQLDYISSQGCRFRCSFCADPNVYNRGWVALTPERIAEEAAALWRQYRFDELAFQDETFFTHAKRVEELCDRLLVHRLPITWTATMRADQGCRLDEALFAKAREAGLSRVMVGVESGSQQMLDWMKKDMKISQVLETAERCARHGIGAIFNFIIGFPDETDDSVSETFALIKRLRRMSPSFETPMFYYRPYPGTEIAAGAVRQGYAFPRTLDGWAEFDYVGSRGPWVSEEKWRRAERFKFYSRHAWGASGALRWPLRVAARWRCMRDDYRFPIEKRVAEFLRPPQPAS
jgi:anaerobic magnesium-protoporphyrin IX monomethyl ester cyclase